MLKKYLRVVFMVSVGILSFLPGSYAQPASNNHDETLKFRLMMVDATLDLNETMLQGIKASIDTLNLPENNSVIKEKDMQTTLLRMKRARDKAMLLPYLLQMKDSLTNEIAILKIEKEKLESMLTPAVQVPTVEVKTQTLISKKDTLVFETKTNIESGAKETVVKNITTNEVIVLNDNMTKAKKKQSERKLRKYKNLIPLDTVLVYDMGTAIKPEPELEKVPLTDTAQEVTISIKPSKEELRKTDKKPSAKQAGKAEGLLKKAQIEIEAGNYSLAEKLLQQCLQLKPDYYEAWLELAEMDAANGLSTKALKEYEKCVELDSTKPDVYYKMGQLYLKANLKKEALLCFNKTIEYNPSSIDALMQRASIYIDFKHLFDAIRDYDRVTQIDKNYYKAYRSRGIAKMNFRLYDDATDDFNRYLIFEPDDAETYYYRGLCRIGNSELADGCIDLSVAASKGYTLAQKALNDHCK
jgi:tetratricopeptide (TPR) repeat protein